MTTQPLNQNIISSMDFASATSALAEIRGKEKLSGKDNRLIGYLEARIQVTAETTNPTTEAAVKVAAAITESPSVITGEEEERALSNATEAYEAFSGATGSEREKLKVPMELAIATARRTEYVQRRVKVIQSFHKGAKNRSKVEEFLEAQRELAMVAWPLSQFTLGATGRTKDILEGTINEAKGIVSRVRAKGHSAGFGDGAQLGAAFLRLEAAGFEMLNRSNLFAELLKEAEARKDNLLKGKSTSAEVNEIWGIEYLKSFADPKKTAIHLMCCSLLVLHFNALKVAEEQAAEAENA